MNLDNLREKFDQLQAEGKEYETIMAEMEEYATAHYSTPEGQAEIMSSPHPEYTVTDAIDVCLNTVSTWFEE